ncbi:MAG: DUF1178 family protein [Amphiplicatus sp.]
MIKYQLRCEASHEFEGWFRGSEDFDAQAADGLLECPACGSSAIAKAIMAPAVARRKGGGSDPKMIEIRAAMTEAVQRARDYVQKNFDYVGEKFPEEARKIHYGETDPRGIYGEASGAEVKALVEEGVSVAPMPAPPARREIAGPVKVKKKKISKKG